jgi:zinc transporter ZupT
VQSAQDAIVGTLLIATGLVFLGLELSGRGHTHDHEHDDHHHHEHRPPRALAVLVPFGAAASPDLTILPVFLAATAAGTVTAVGALVAFAVVTIATMLALTLLATLSGYGLREHWLEHWGNRFTAAVLIVIGALVLVGVL